MAHNKIRRFFHLAPKKPAGRTRISHPYAPDMDALLAPGASNAAGRRRKARLRVVLTSTKSGQPAAPESMSIDGSWLGAVAMAVEAPAASPAAPLSAPLRAPSTPMLSLPQTRALCALQNVVPAAKWHGDRSTDGSAQHTPSYLVPLDGHGHALRLSPTFAQGSYTKVRVGLDETGEPCGVMVMHPGLKTRRNAQTIHITPFERIQQNLQILERIRSPLRPRGQYADQEGRVYWTVPLMAGDLIDFAQLPQPKDPDAFRFMHLLVFREAARSMVPAFFADIVHADIKPDNFLVSKDLSTDIVLADVGLAVDSNTLRTGAGRGTPGYIAPEMMFDTDEKITTRADIFSLGMTFAAIANNSASVFDIGRSRKGPNDHAHVAVRAIADLATVRAHRYDPSAFAPSLSRHAIVRLYRGLNALHPELGTLVFDQMLRQYPHERPSTLNVLATLQQMLPYGSQEEAYGRRAFSQARSALAHNSGGGGTERTIAALRAMPPRPRVFGEV